MLKRKPQDNPYPDGIIKVYCKVNQSEPGNMPSEVEEHCLTLRYRRRTVGINRYYTAMQHQQQIDEVLRCPLVPNVSARDIAEVFPGGKRYVIRQVQYPEGTVVPEMDLALERLDGSGGEGGEDDDG